MTISRALKEPLRTTFPLFFPSLHISYSSVVEIPWHPTLSLVKCKAAPSVAVLI